MSIENIKPSEQILFWEEYSYHKHPKAPPISCNVVAFAIDNLGGGEGVNQKTIDWKRIELLNR